jgi:hypothetical protein
LDLDSYLDCVTFSGGWTGETATRVTSGQVPFRGKFLPTEKGKIPLLDYTTISAQNDTNDPASSSTGASSTVLANAMVSLGSELGSSIRLASGQGAPSVPRIFVDSYESFDEFLAGSALPAGDKTWLKDACNNNLATLAECIASAQGSSLSFSTAFAEFVPSFPPMSCMMVLARAKEERPTK